jgi:hypothetical protein
MSEPNGATPGAVIVTALTRFPAAMIAAAAGTVLELSDWPGSGPWRVGLAVAFFWSVALRLPLEANRRVPALAAQAAPWLAGLVLVLVPGWPRGEIPYSMMTLAGAGLLAVAAVPVAAPAVDRSAMVAAWIRGSLRSAALAGLATVMLCLGLTLLALGFDALFETRLDRSIIWRVWVVGIGLGLPWCTLALLPRLDSQETATAVPRWIRGLLDWLLAPLALAFGALLNGYCLFILVRGDLPKGVIATLVIALSMAGCLVWSGAIAVGGEAGRATQVLRRAFLPGLLAPAVALAVAVGLRIRQHGLTEDRYLLVLAAVVLIAAAGLQLVRRRVPSPPQVGAIAVALLVAASVGPWSATSLSIADQSRRLLAALERVGHLRDGQIEPAGAVVSGADAGEITSIVQFLVGRGQEGAVRALFRTPPGDVGGGGERALVEAMGVRYVPHRSYDADRHDALKDSVVWTADRDPVTVVSGFDYILSRSLTDRSAAFTAKTDDGPLEIAIEPTPGALLVNRDGAHLARFDLGELLTGPRLTTGPVLSFDRVAADGTKLRLRLSRLSGTRSPDQKSRVNDVEFQLLVTRKPRGS